MINGGEGGLSLGPIQMDQYYLLTENCPFNTREEAERLIAAIRKDTYGVHGQPPVTPVGIDFQITESKGKFYIWYKPL
jgi:hypothetical protein